MGPSSCMNTIYLALLFWLLSCWTLQHHTITAVRVYDEARLEKLRNEVKSMFYHAYDSYIQNAYPYDELRPLSCDGIDTWGSYSLTLIDTLDTLVVLGNYSEFRRVAQLIIENAHFDMNINVSVFETNIRIIGGLLSAHLLSHKAGMEVDKGWPCNGPLLHLAEKVARKLLPAFDTSTGMPYGTVNLRYGVPSKETPITCTAGVGTFIVEFATLSRLTGDSIYEKVALRALHSLYSRRSRIDLFGNHIDTDSGKWTALDSGIGAGVDSFFEYLVKGGILFQKPELLHMFKVSYAAIEKHLGKSGWYIWATMGQGHVSTTTFQSLEAYWPGLLSLIGEFRTGLKAITNYHRIWKQYGALPELYNIVQGSSTHQREGYPLRPELIESAMYLYRATRDPFMLEIGEDILFSIQKNAKTDCGYATIRDVTTLTLEDRMESFFLAETVKYLYLLFDPANFLHNDGDDYTVIDNPIGKCTVYAGGYIFNTEAHPIDPSALHCCTGVTERELHEEIAIIDELRTTEKYRGRGSPKPKPQKEQQQPKKSSKPTNEKQPLKLQLAESVELATGNGKIVKIESQSEFMKQLESILSTNGISSPDNSASATSCTKDSIIPYPFHRDRGHEKTCSILGPTKDPIASIEDKVAVFEQLLQRLIDEENRGDSSGPQSVKIQVTVQEDQNGIKTTTTMAGPPGVSFTSKTRPPGSPSNEEIKTREINKLIQKFETIETINEQKKNINKRKPVPKPMSPGIETQKSGTMSTTSSSTKKPDPDLDLIFHNMDPTLGKSSLSFYFSLKWLRRFPELIIQLIPSESFDIQNFYSRLNSQFSNEGFSKDFNLSMEWTKDYEMLRCDNIGFADRFMFLKSSLSNN